MATKISQLSAASALTGTETLPIVQSGTTVKSTIGDISVSNLADYEEGTFTPAITFGDASVGMAYSVQSGSYTKIGNRIFYNIYMALTNKGSSTGFVKITGFPFAGTSVGAEVYSSPTFRFNNISVTNLPSGYLSPSGTTMQLLQTTTAGALTFLDNSDFANNSDIMVAGHYRI